MSVKCRRKSLNKVSHGTVATSHAQSVACNPPTGLSINIIGAHSEVRKNSNKRNINFVFLKFGLVVTSTFT